MFIFMTLDLPSSFIEFPTVFILNDARFAFNFHLFLFYYMVLSIIYPGRRATKKFLGQGYHPRRRARQIEFKEDRLGNIFQI